MITHRRENAPSGYYVEDEEIPDDATVYEDEMPFFFKWFDDAALCEWI